MSTLAKLRCWDFDWLNLLNVFVIGGETDYNRRDINISLVDNDGRLFRTTVAQNC